MIVVDRHSSTPRPKVGGAPLRSVAVPGASDFVDASQALAVELASRGIDLVRRLAREGAVVDDVRAMLTFLYDVHFVERPVVIACRFRDALAFDFDIDGDDEPHPAYSIVHPDETPVVFYDAPVSVYCGDTVALRTVAYGVFPLIDPETADSLYVSMRNDRFVFGESSDQSDVCIRLSAATSRTIAPSGIDVRHVDIASGPKEVVAGVRERGEEVSASLRVDEGDIAFLCDFDPQWLDLFDPVTLKPVDWAHAVERGVFITNGNPLRFPGRTPNLVRGLMRRAVHRAYQTIEGIAIWPFLSPDETAFAETARVDGVWNALPPVEETGIVYLPATTDIVRFALELEKLGCMSIRPPAITETHVLIAATAKDGTETTFLVPIDDRRFSWE